MEDKVNSSSGGDEPATATKVGESSAPTATNDKNKTQVTTTTSEAPPTSSLLPPTTETKFQSQPQIQTSTPQVQSSPQFPSPSQLQSPSQFNSPSQPPLTPQPPSISPSKTTTADSKQTNNTNSPTKSTKSTSRSKKKVPETEANPPSANPPPANSSSADPPPAKKKRAPRKKTPAESNGAKSNSKTPSLLTTTTPAYVDSKFEASGSENVHNHSGKALEGLRENTWGHLSKFVPNDFMNKIPVTTTNKAPPISTLLPATIETRFQSSPQFQTSPQFHSPLQLQSPAQFYSPSQLPSTPQSSISPSKTADPKLNNNSPAKPTKSTSRSKKKAPEPETKASPPPPPAKKKRAPRKKTQDEPNATNTSNNAPSLLTTMPPANVSTKLEVNVSEDDNDLAKAFEELRDNTWTHLSRLVLERAQQFDIASLIGMLYNLRSENEKLVNKVKDLTLKRDQLVALNARLDLPGPLLAQHLNNTSSGFSSITGLISSPRGSPAPKLNSSQSGVEPFLRSNSSTSPGQLNYMWMHPSAVTHSSNLQR